MRSLDHRFSRRETVELADRLFDLYGRRSIAAVMSAGVDMVRAFFHTDFIGVGLCDPRRHRVLGIGYPAQVPVAPLTARLSEIATQSPLFQHWSVYRDHDRVLRQSDCQSLAEFQATDLHADFFKPLGFTRQMGTWLRAGGGRHLEIGLYRGGSDFTSRDIARLTLLRGHLMQAYRNALMFEADSPPLSAEPLQIQNATVNEYSLTSISTHLDALPKPAALTDALTPREREVLRYLAEGKSNPEIAAILGSRWKTVSKHAENIYRKLNVENRTTAAMRAHELGLLVQC